MSLTKLFEESKQLNYQGTEMARVEEMRGPGFFPGCTGTLDSRENIGGLRFMVLGQDFDTKSNHEAIVAEKGEIETNTTWKNLRILLQDICVDENECFFTNSYLGLRQSEQNKKIKNTGTSPAARKGAENFANECITFFKKQLEVVQPEVVLVLGKETARFISKAFPMECSKWAKIKTLKLFYEREQDMCLTANFNQRVIHFLFVIHLL